MFTILDLVRIIDPAELIVLIGVDLAWDMARMVYMYALNNDGMNQM